MRCKIKLKEEAIAATSSDKLKALVKMKNWVCLKITGLGKKIHRLKIPNF
jgi:hypothetical protein